MYGEKWEHTQSIEILLSSLQCVLLLLRPGIMWALQLSQGRQSTGNSKAAQVVPMGLLSPHLTMDPLNRPTALVSSSEVSGGKRGEGVLSRPRGLECCEQTKGRF